MPKKTRNNIAENYCPLRAWQLGTREIKFPEEHTHCGKKRCWMKQQNSSIRDVFKDSHDCKVSVINVSYNKWNDWNYSGNYSLKIKQISPLKWTLKLGVYFIIIFIYVTWTITPSKFYLSNIYSPGETCSNRGRQSTTLEDSPSPAGEEHYKEGRRELLLPVQSLVHQPRCQHWRQRTCLVWKEFLLGKIQQPFFQWHGA